MLLPSEIQRADDLVGIDTPIVPLSWACAVLPNSSALQAAVTVRAWVRVLMNFMRLSPPGVVERVQQIRRPTNVKRAGRAAALAWAPNNKVSL
jgi:hypothetical protein